MIFLTITLLAGCASQVLAGNNGSVARRSELKINPTVTMKDGHLHIKSLGVTFEDLSTTSLEIQAKQNELTSANADGNFDLAKSLIAEIEALQVRDQNEPPKSISVAEIDDKLNTLDSARVQLEKDVTADIAEKTNTLKTSLTKALETLRTDTETAATKAATKTDEMITKASRETDGKCEKRTVVLEDNLNKKFQATSNLVQNLEMKLSKLERSSKSDLAELSTAVKTTNTNLGLAVTKYEKFQMPELGSWSQNGAGVTTSCSAGHKGELRRIKGSDDKHIESIVYCTGKAWKRISPIMGTANDHRLPGGGCVMRDVHSYRTANGGCRTIDFKTNIMARKATMFTIKVEGYNYGSGSHISNTASGYTYAHWSCSGSRSNRNYGNGANIDQYCAGANVVIRMNMRGGSYYAGMSLTASFLNPTGDNMCGRFKVLETKCNGRF